MFPHFEGTAIHDHWKTYFEYECKNGLCNAHRLRELFFLADYHFQIWVKELVDEAKIREKPCLSKEKLKVYESKYDDFIISGLITNPEQIKEKDKQGKQKENWYK